MHGKRPLRATGEVVMRKPMPWYSKTRSGGGWFVQVGGEQHPLGKHPEGEPAPRKKRGRWEVPQAILDEFYELMSLRDTASKDDYTVEVLCGLYLEELGIERPDLVKRYKPVLGAFCDCRFKKGGREVGEPFGKLLVNAQLDTQHLKAWASEYPSDQTRRTYINAVKAVFEWAVAKKSINVTKNPVAAVSAPKVRSRAVVITGEEHEGLLKLWDGDDAICDLLKAMWATGARPGELSKIEASHYRDGLWSLRPEEHKTGGKTGKERVIAVVEELVEIVERRCKLHPTGPIFLNSHGRKWDAQALYVRFQTAKRATKVRKAVIREDVVPYSYRHAWATHALEQGLLSDWEVAKALGHVTTQMVHLHYDHSRRNPDHIRDIFERARR
jgi:integrase